MESVPALERERKLSEPRGLPELLKQMRVETKEASDQERGEGAH